jgi:hypothetical protein
MRQRKNFRRNRKVKRGGTIKGKTIRGRKRGRNRTLGERKEGIQRTEKGEEEEPNEDEKVAEEELLWKEMRNSKKKKK